MTSSGFRYVQSFFEDVPVAVALWEQILDASDLPTGQRAHAKHCLGLSYMGLGRCSDALGMFSNEEQIIDDLSIVDVFNYGMAMWGANGTVQAAPFSRVVELDRANGRKNESPNYLQCMAIAYWATDDSAAAIDYVERAQRAAGGIRGRTEFSCWRYLQVGAKSFEADLGEIRTLIEDGGTGKPRFVAETDNGATGGVVRTQLLARINDQFVRRSRCCASSDSMRGQRCRRQRPNESTLPSRPGKWQRVSRPSASGCHAGASLRHRSRATGQRVWKWQPEGGSMGLGISPASGTRRSAARGSDSGTAEINARCRDAAAGRRSAPRRPSPRPGPDT